MNATQPTAARAPAAPRPQAWRRWLARRRSVIAFDLGSEAVRACQVRRRGARLETCDALRVFGVAGAAASEPEVVADAARCIARCVEQGEFAGRDVGLVLSVRDAHFHTLRLPDGALRQPPDRLAEMLRWEAARAVRAEPSEIEVSSWCTPAGTVQAHNVMTVSTRAALAGAWARELAKRGLCLRHIDAAPCAQVRAAALMWPPADNDVWGVLDLGARQVTLTVAVGDVPVYVRALSASPRHWTERIAAALEAPWDAAEQLKRRFGIVGGPCGEASGDREALGPLIFGVLTQPLGEMVGEIVRCLGYVLESFPDSSAARLVLAGGGADLPGLVEFLELQVGIAVGVLRLDDGRLRVSPDTATALGGALLDLESA